MTGSNYVYIVSAYYTWISDQSLGNISVNSQLFAVIKTL